MTTRRAAIVLTEGERMALTSILGEYIRLAARAGERPEFHREIIAAVALLPVNFYNGADESTVTIEEILIKWLDPASWRPAAE